MSKFSIIYWKLQFILLLLGFLVSFVDSSVRMLVERVSATELVTFEGDVRRVLHFCQELV